MTCYTEELIDEVLKQIVEDVGNGDVTAIEELLQGISSPRLLGYLQEEKATALCEKWGVVEVDWTQ